MRFGLTAGFNTLPVEDHSAVLLLPKPFVSGSLGLNPENDHRVMVTENVEGHLYDRGGYSGTLEGCEAFVSGWINGRLNGRKAPR